MNKLFKHAFTLIELLVVIAIIGILSGLIVVSMGGMTTKATIAKAQVFSNSLRNSLMLNLLSEWKFDGPTSDGVAATANDVSDTWGNYDCAISGSILTRIGNNCIFGSCLDFNGGYLSCGNLGIMSGGTATIEGWFYSHTSAKTRASDMAYFYPLYQHNANDMLYVIGTAHYTGTPGEINKWNHVVFTYSGNCSTGIAYFNLQKNTVHLQGADCSVPASSNFYIGGNFSGTFDGLIDNVRVYNNIVPTSQIKEHYYAGINKLFTSGSISQEEYQNRIMEIAIK